MFRGRVERLHLVGIGGSGMSGIAEVLATMGFSVAGSDLVASQATSRLESMGIHVHRAHQAEQVAGADVVVVSSAIGADNPEVAEARRRGIPVIARAEMLAELMRLKYGIAVAGSHGKTTTTSLVAAALEQGGFDPTHVIGGRLKAIDAHARLGAGEYLVAEADESDGSFLRLAPTIAVVTNIDAEHLDHWRGGLPEITRAFLAFLGKVPFYGAAVVCLDHPTVQALLPELGRRVVTYGRAPQADWRADNIVAQGRQMAFDVSHLGRPRGRVTLGLVGEHNVLNALAALAVADEVGVSLADARRALTEFAGIARRFEVKGERGGVLVVDDYGHHPAEIVATLEAALAAFAGRRLVVVFQPHRYSRTLQLEGGFARAFNRCHRLFVLDIYAAGEAPIDGVTGARLARAILASGHRQVSYLGPPRAARAQVLAELVPGDVLITLGAGDVTLLSDQLLEDLAGRP